MSVVFHKFRAAVDSIDLSSGLNAWPESLLMRRDGEWATYYAPFDHVNAHARVVLVGITPGLTQVANGLRAMQIELRRGTDIEHALEIAKGAASFSGAMRPNLIELLNAIGVPAWLGLHSSAQLFADRTDLVHYTSALRYPVTRHGENYSGTPRIVATAYTRDELHWFVEETISLRGAVFIPLGPAVTEAMELLVSQGKLGAERILSGLPHPSGANAERIAYFVGRKPRDALSKKTDPAKLDRAREDLIERVSRLQRG